jgi:hypothetical protein
VTTELWSTLGIISQIAASIVTVVGILFIARQVSDTRRFTKSQLLNDLEKESKEYRHVYMMITDSWRLAPVVSPQENQLHDIFDCLGFFVRIKILLDNQVIDMPTVNRLFAYRFFLLVNDPNVQKFALYPDGFDFTTVFALHKQLKQYRLSRRDEIAGSETDLSLHNPEEYNKWVIEYSRKK